VDLNSAQAGHDHAGWSHLHLRQCRQPQDPHGQAFEYNAYFTYDNIYQLQLAKQGATTKETYSYDPVGNRLSSLGVTPYLYNSSNELTSLPNVGYTYDNNGNTKSKTDTSGITNYYEAAGLGSIASLTDSSGTIAATYSYDSFGKVLSSTGSIINPLRYTARELDSETGVYYYRARYLDQSTGRFVSEDPFRF